ncbi:MAG: hypothetical protein IT440_00110 [Phycisphaeraceae bacterium]|nr:hypothetical protein [Phycisphaeraceae bacterium]
MPTFPPLNRHKTNPISLRIWYPRIADDASFDRLLGHLQYIHADRVYFFDNGYMDNYQLAPQTLAERLPILKKRIAKLKEHGIVGGINSGATIGHGGNFAGAERLMDLDWWVANNGDQLVGIACPLGDKFQQWLTDYYRGLAETGAEEIFIDDDLRLYNHGAAPVGDWGCFCPRHLAEMKKRTGLTLTREQLSAEIGKRSPGLVQEAWISLWKENFLHLLGIMEKAVHAVNPKLRLGLMPVQNFIRDFGEDFLQDAIRVISTGNRPLLRTHDYHCQPHEMYPGSGLAAKRTAPPESEHLAEIENTPHNHHEYVRSPKTTRYAILASLALGMGGAAVTFGDDQRDMPWEKAYLDMLRDNDPFFRTVADLVYRDTVLQGIPIRRRAYQRKVRYIDSIENIWNDSIHEQPDSLAGIFGVAYQFDPCPVWLLGEIPATMAPEEIEFTLKRGAVIDSTAVKCLHRLGYGSRLGVKAGQKVPYHRGHRFLPHDLTAPYGGDINALRVNFEVFHLEAEKGCFEEVSEFVSWAGNRVAGGILVQNSRDGRNVILPHALSMSGFAFTGIVNTQYRHLMRRLLAHSLGQPMKLHLEAPSRIWPYYHERADGAAIITLLNAYYDDISDFAIVLGEGERLSGKKVYRVMPDGRLEHRPTLQLHREQNGTVRLRIDKANALMNCDVLVLMIA